MSKEATERESMRALATDVEEIVSLSKDFYSCLVKDVKRVSGNYQAVQIPPSAPVPIITVEEKAPESPPKKR